MVRLAFMTAAAARGDGLPFQIPTLLTCSLSSISSTAFAFLSTLCSCLAVSTVPATRVLAGVAPDTDALAFFSSLRCSCSLCLCSLCLCSLCLCSSRLCLCSLLSFFLIWLSCFVLALSTCLIAIGLILWPSFRLFSACCRWSSTNAFSSLRQLFDSLSCG